ncbi:hypothetical protein [Lactiplantibacillus plantarum]|uniref:hypothetical protein n=1 Tax=Lactiplantibacillus plantarum TaxID=1590 RepID=UPI0007C2356B|nr:hypothetical protein [Lactiplantibacillus plantarum]KZT88757.1 hypothetical protein Nizo2029_0932 [Lactiplantibacillus plantarum]MDN7015043.1 hypothetical protein [Lactiplantibacillus plantarum]MDN7049035.1 hypothetical protein [Lactiplantibacillus plantarum]MDN7052119.1 hypothetical protein [Lactiplantibacillus plantarum]MDN7055268.1 hypothetical protein [Lactiplantibacillus plantarum]
MDIVKSSDVFTPGTDPGATYNDRAKQQLDKKINNTLKIGGKIVILTGQTKVGKTVLVRKVIPDSQRIEIQSGDIKDVSNIEELIAKKLGEIPVEKKARQVTQKSMKDSITVDGELEAKVSFWNFVKSKVGIKSQISLDEKKGNAYIETFEDDLYDRLMEYIIKNDYVLIFDDFHYLSKTEQKELIHRLKNPLSQKAKIIIVLIPNRKEDVIAAEKDMQGRTKEIKVPQWTKEELSYIPKSGFRKLNIEFSDNELNKIVENSFSNPYLIQDICSEICLKFEIFETRQETTHVELNDQQMREVFSGIDHTSSLIDDIERGKTTKGSKRKQFSLKNDPNSKLDTYELIIRALGKLAHKNVIEASELVDAVHELALNDKGEPRKSDIVGTLGRMVEIARKKDPKDPAIDYEDNRLKMYDPFFSFDIRWRNQE